MKKSLRKIDWTNNFIQLIIVTVGILIAYLLNSWNESNKEKKLTQLYLIGLHQELADNRELLFEALAYHEKMLENLNTNPLEVRMQLRPATLNNAAWKLAENTVFRQRIPPGLYKDLINIYQLHDQLNELNANATKMMSELNVMAPLYLFKADKLEEDENTLKEYVSAQRRGWVPIFEEWTAYEKMYLESIEKVIPAIENTLD